MIDDRVLILPGPCMVWLIDKQSSMSAILTQLRSQYLDKCRFPDLQRRSWSQSLFQVGSTCY